MNNVWDQLKDDYENYPSDFGGNLTSEDQVVNAEKDLECSFSDDYKFFLKNYGSGVLPGHIIYGLVPHEEMGDNIKSVIDKTIFYKQTQKWPGIDDWYVVSDDGRGNPIGCKPDGSVWLSDHDAGFEQIKLTDSFEGFLHKLLTDTLYK